MVYIYILAGSMVARRISARKRMELVCCEWEVDSHWVRERARRPVRRVERLRSGIRM
jgi:hypothetical protein